MIIFTIDTERILGWLLEDYYVQSGLVIMTSVLQVEVPALLSQYK